MEIIKGLILVIIIGVLVGSCAPWTPQQSRQYEVFIIATEGSQVTIELLVEGIDTESDIKSDKKTDVSPEIDVSVIPK